MFSDLYYIIRIVTLTSEITFNVCNERLTEKSHM